MSAKGMKKSLLSRLTFVLLFVAAIIVGFITMIPEILIYTVRFIVTGDEFPFPIMITWIEMLFDKYYE